jgi:hypothetical protein
MAGLMLLTLFPMAAESIPSVSAAFVFAVAAAMALS